MKLYYRWGHVRVCLFVCVCVRERGFVCVCCESMNEVGFNAGGVCVCDKNSEKE